MGLYAFDIELQAEVEAQHAIKKPRGCYLCPDRKCKEMRVPVFLVETDYGKHYSSYNASLHHSDCDFVSSYNAQYRNRTVDGFDPYELLNKLIKTKQSTDTKSKTTLTISSKNTDTVSPTTLRKLYHLCMSNDLDFHLNDDYTVGDICVSLRNEIVWKKRNWDDRILLVIGTVYHVDWKRHSVILAVSDKLKVAFEFSEVQHYQEFYSRLRKFSGTSSVKLAIYGVFHKQAYSVTKGDKQVNYERNTTKIGSINQITFLDRCR